MACQVVVINTVRPARRWSCVDGFRVVRARRDPRGIKGLKCRPRTEVGHSGGARPSSLVCLSVCLYLQGCASPARAGASASKQNRDRWWKRIIEAGERREGEEGGEDEARAWRGRDENNERQRERRIVYSARDALDFFRVFSRMLCLKIFEFDYLVFVVGIGRRDGETNGDYGPYYFARNVRGQSKSYWFISPLAISSHKLGGTNYK